MKKKRLQDLLAGTDLPRQVPPRRGSRYLPGEALWHGTSPAAVPKILAEGLRPSLRRQRWSLRTALAAMEPDGRLWGAHIRSIRAANTAGNLDLVSELEDAWEERYEQFMDEAAIPMAGYVYLTTVPSEILFRSEHGEPRYAFRVEPTGELLPDEDWTGAALVWATRPRRRIQRADEPLARQTVLDAERAHPLLTEAWRLLPNDVANDVRMAEEQQSASVNFEWQALAGKAAIGALHRSHEGRAILKALTRHASSLAHKGAPRVVGLYEMNKEGALLSANLRQQKPIA